MLEKMNHPMQTSMSKTHVRSFSATQHASALPAIGRGYYQVHGASMLRALHSITYAYQSISSPFYAAAPAAATE